MRKFAVALVLASLAAAAPSFADVTAPVARPQAVALLWTPAQIAKVKEQIGLQEARAKELQPIVARDISAREALQTDADVLEKAAKDMRTQAADFKITADTAPDKKTKDEFLAFAKEVESFATHNDNNAKIHRELARHLEGVIHSMQGAITFHLAAAAKLKTALAANS